MSTAIPDEHVQESVVRTYYASLYQLQPGNASRWGHGLDNYMPRPSFFTASRPSTRANLNPIYYGTGTDDNIGYSICNFIVHIGVLSTFGSYTGTIGSKNLYIASWVLPAVINWWWMLG